MNAVEQPQSEIADQLTQNEQSTCDAPQRTYALPKPHWKRYSSPRRTDQLTSHFSHENQPGPRCCAKKKNSPGICRQPAMRNAHGVYTRCRLHGGKNRGAPGNQNALKHGKRARVKKSVTNQLDPSNKTAPSEVDLLKAIADATVDE